MTWGGIVFPGTVLLLKLAFKLTIEQELDAVDVAKALLSFPVDIAFLSFSFGAALLYAKPVSEMHDGTVRNMFVALILAVILLVCTTVFSKKSDKAFTLERFWKSGFLVFVSYVFSFLALFGAMNVGAIG
jgi:hypothetical protein